jgi:manganese/zinc/iron transport system permease protein
VAIGAGLLGFAAGAAGTFLFLRKRALVSDAVAHATLPGVGLAFIVMVALGGDGRNLPGLLAGSAVTAGRAAAREWIDAAHAPAEDAAIGAVLSVFFGIGIVLLTVIQTMSAGRQAGLEDFLLGSTAGMLRGRGGDRGGRRARGAGHMASAPADDAGRLRSRAMRRRSARRAPHRPRDDGAR